MDGMSSIDSIVTSEKFQGIATLLSDLVVRWIDESDHESFDDYRGAMVEYLDGWVLERMTESFEVAVIVDGMYLFVFHPELEVSDNGSALVKISVGCYVKKAN